MKKLFVILMLVGMMSFSALGQESGSDDVVEDGDGIIEPGED